MQESPDNLAGKKVCVSKEDGLCHACGHDGHAAMALGAMRALREAGRRVPEDCSVIAIDGLTMSEYFQPVLTTL